MVRILAVADEVVESLWQPTVRRLRPDLIAACGDLPLDYLDYLVSMVDRPLVFVPGNHDADLSGVRYGRSGLPLAAGHPAADLGPPGGINVDGRVVDVAGLRVAGLGGCVRYRPGPNQYSQRQYARRGGQLACRIRRAMRRDGRPLDLLLTHAPPLRCGDGADGPHVGIAALHPLVEAVTPNLLLHGHIHPYGAPAPDRQLGQTRICNVVGRRVLELATAGMAA